MTLDPTDLRTYPVQPTPCVSCPFAGKRPIRLVPEDYAKYVANLLQEGGQHFCHTVNNTAICRGGRDLQLRYFFGRKLLIEPTDAAFDAAIEAALARKSEKMEETNSKD